MMPKPYSQDDIAFMQQALDLAKNGRYTTAPNPAVGCVLVKDGEIIGEGWHRKAGMPHAEREALADAKAKGHDVRGATAYVTLEPCSHTGRTPPCADGLIEAGISRCVVAMQDPNPQVAGEGIRKLQQAGIQTEVGVLSQQARALNPGFLSHMEQKRPFVRLKMATSLDGRTALANGESKWITGPLSREQVHKLRAQHGAVITGIGTVLADDPSLTVRLPEAVLKELNITAEVPHPLRVVLDANLSMPLDAKMLSLPGRTLIMTTKEAVEREQSICDALIEAGAEVIAVSADEDKIHLPTVLNYLLTEEQVNEVMVEAGAVVAGSFIQQGLVDELHHFVAPIILGDGARGMFHLPQLERMEDKIRFQFQASAQLGADMYHILVPERPESNEEAG
jgi:diaminohydroxyphosphoribosylaminopyrimidine deaminase/5-amino-6-(5-phosphoribosylamino)uracil reductase